MRKKQRRALLKRKQRRVRRTIGSFSAAAVFAGVLVLEKALVAVFIEFLTIRLI
jgi:hypothetical protein